MSPFGDLFKPLSQAFGLLAPLSGEPLLKPLQILKKYLFIASPERRGGPPKAVEGFINPSAIADTLIPHSSFLIDLTLKVKYDIIKCVVNFHIKKEIKYYEIWR